MPSKDDYVEEIVDAIIKDPASLDTLPNLRAHMNCLRLYFQFDVGGSSCQCS